MTLQLTAKQVAAAEVCGVVFSPANSTEVERLAMQRRVFTVDGQHMLASRGGGFYETAGTLGSLIEEGLRQLADLEAWERSSQQALGDEAPSVSPPPAASPPRSATPKAPVQRHAIPEQPSAPAPPVVGALDCMPPDIVDRGEGSGELAAQRAVSAGERWLTAGAARRGRAAQHWSTRRRSS